MKRCMSCADPQIAGRLEQLELPVWTESQELRRFIAGYLALLPTKRWHSVGLFKVYFKRDSHGTPRAAYRVAAGTGTVGDPSVASWTTVDLNATINADAYLQGAGWKGVPCR